MVRNSLLKFQEPQSFVEAFSEKVFGELQRDSLSKKLSELQTEEASIGVLPLHSFQNSICSPERIAYKVATSIPNGIVDMCTYNYELNTKWYYQWIRIVCYDVPYALEAYGIPAALLKSGSNAGRPVSRFIATLV